MKTIVHFACALLLGVLTLSSASAADGGASIQAVLVTASKGDGRSDAKLAAYVETLKRAGPYDTFKFVAEGSARVAKGGNGSISLGGHQVELSGVERAGNDIRVKIKWSGGGRELFNTSLVLPVGVGVALGRGGEVVLLIGR